MFEFCEFKGSKCIKLLAFEGDNFGFTFGAKKARLILDNLEAIKSFTNEPVAEATEGGEPPKEKTTDDIPF